MRDVPRGSRVLSFDARCAYLTQSEYFPVPYVEGLEGLDDLASYARQHGVTRVELDPLLLRKHPSGVLRGLAEGGAWPPGWRVLEAAGPASPAWVLEVEDGKVASYVR